MPSLAIDPFASGVLNKDVHNRLVADLPAIAKDASIVPDWIWKPLGKSVGMTELDYVRKWKHHKANRSGGICYVGHDNMEAVDNRMSAIIGALLRNFIRGRVMTVEEVLQHADETGSAPTHSALAIPNFYVLGAKLPEWKLAVLMDILLQRRLAGQQTLLYVSDLQRLGTDSPAMADYIKAHYTVIKA